jgi:DNA-directed RNA polymerase subunit beta'
MSTFSPEQNFESLKSRMETALKEFFPLEGRSSEIVLHGVEVRDNKDVGDIRDQREALVRGKSWTVPVYADLELRRRGKEVDRKKVLVMHLPKTTDRFGYIVDGNEYQVLNQFRLKSGVYHRVAPNGDALAEFNLANPDQFANNSSFRLKFKPDEAVFYVWHRNSNVPAYHLLKSIGVTDDQLEKTWGKEILRKNKEKASEDKAIKALHRATKGASPKEVTEEDRQLMRELLDKTQLLEETTEKTLGKKYKKVDGDLLLRSSKNLLEMTKGNREPDDKHSLEFQSVHSFEDLLAGQIRRNGSRIRRKMLNNIDKKRSVRSVVTAEVFDRPLKSFFTTSLVTQPEQTNPLEMISGSRKTTIMGEQGGIQSAHAIMEEAKLINPSHLGFLDPIHTPEGEKTGVSLSLPLTVQKKNNELVSHFYDARTGRRKELTSGEALHATVAFPDQYETKGKSKLVPTSKRVRATRNGKIVVVDPKEVDYVIPSARGIFGVSSNLIPFLQNNQGNRATMAAKQQEQAIPLEHREVPLVQVKTDKEKSFEEILGGLSAKKAKVAGEVHQVKKDAIVIKDKRGKLHEQQIYRDFALKGNSLYDSDVVVKKGDKVKKGQLLADSTFTKGGTLALGTNLRAAYLPYFGYNFEDGIVISEAAAKKLTSLHIHSKDTRVDSDTRIGRGTFLSQYPHAFQKEQLENVDEDGLVRIGSEVKEGDPLILALTRPSATAQQKALSVFRRGRPDKFRDRSLVWDKSAPGVVTDVVKRGKEIVVYVKTKEPAQIGDKLVGRHANKGVITRIVPESEMPFTVDEKGEKTHVDIALNPMGIPGRINLGQVYETVAGKVAKKRGKAYKVRNFEGGKDYLKEIQKELEEAGFDVDGKEEMIDPRTGKPFEQKVLVGDQYILKLKHQATKKMSARSGSGGKATPYDINHAPAGGAPHGGMSMGELGMYSLLAHGARQNLYEMYAYKSNRNDDLWDAIREGTPLPPPKVPFSYTKFLGYLNGMRVNVKKEGNHLQLVPFTEKQVQAMSAGELKEPGLLLRGKDLRPLTGGLFDENITGGMQGTRWSHFKLEEPMPNPLFEEAIKKLAGLSGKQFRAIVNGSVEIDGKRGGEALESMLSNIDVKKERASVEERLQRARGATRNKLHKKLRILKALDDANLDPTVYMMRSVPVLPPVFRPVTVKEDGSLSSDDINGLYKDIGAVNEVLAMNKKLGIPEKHMEDIRSNLYDGLKAMTGMGGSLTREYRGILDVIAGKVRRGPTSTGGAGAKQGFFQKNVMKRRQDFTARSIITPEPNMGVDELGLPTEIAWTMYQPFIERQLIRQGYKPLDAIDAVRDRTPAAERAMDRAVEERPVLLKRDPSLHKFNVMAFKPRLVSGKAIEIHPLVTGGYNADFDGDAMSVYLPISSKAVKEAHGMYPSNNLFSPTTGAVMYTPGHEALLGMYLLSMKGKRTKKSYKTGTEAKAAERKGEVRKTDVIRVAGHETTVGRLLIEEKLPAKFRETGKKSIDKMTVYDKKRVGNLLSRLAKSEPDKYGEIVNHIKDLGNNHSTEAGFSVGLNDFTVINRKERDEILGAAEKEADRIRKDKKLNWQQKNSRIVKIFTRADERLDKLNNDHISKNRTNLSTMVDSGSRGSRIQLNQIVSTPTLLLNTKSEVVPYLVPKSYSEGMDVASYWTTLHGARKGAIQKVQGVRDPGYLTKQVVNSTIDQLVTEENCGTNDGVRLRLDDHDILDRYLARGVRVGGHRYRAGTLVTPKMIADAKKDKKARLEVRSPLRCEADHGICKKCMGLTEGGKDYDIGTNVGVIAAQSIGEPSTQLSLNVFHTGGLAKGKGAKSANTFDRLGQLLRMPKNLPNASPLALTSGTVSKVEKAPQGGEYLYIKDSRHYIPATQKRKAKVGQRISKGDALTDGVSDPKQLLALKGIRPTQDYLTDEIQSVMETAIPIKRRNVEVVVKAMTNVTRLDDSGDHDEWVTGDIRPASQVEAWNRRERRKAAKEKRKAKQVRHTPVIKGVDVLPIEVQEDWIARLNFQRLSGTLAQAAREGWRSNIHGFHPVPGLAHATEFGKGKERLREKWKGQY